MRAATDILGLEVPIASIEAELRKLWEADEASTKASLINFAIYSEADDALARNTALLAEITRDHSCRAILIGAGLDRAESHARAWITAHCHLSGGRKSVCSEQLAFQLDGKAIGRIRNIVFAHLESDLPLVLWWQGELSRIFEPHLVNLIDRLIVDAAEWRDVPAQFRLLGEVLKQAPPGLVVHDLEWTRSFQMRLALASLFDDPAATAWLPGITGVRIAHRPGHRIAALHVLAWLSTHLGWQADPVLGRLDLHSPNQTIRVELSETAPGDGALESLELMATADVRFLVARDPACTYYRTESGEVIPPHRGLAPSDPHTLGGLISAQLERAGTNSLLRRILPVSLRLAGVG